MSFRWSLFAVLIVFNGIALAALWRTAGVWISNENWHRRTRWIIAIAVLVLNLPLTAFFIRPLDMALLQIPTAALELFFYPATAWLAAIIAFVLFAAVPTIALTLVTRIVRWSRNRGEGAATSQIARAGLTRRQFLAGGSGLLIPPFYAVAAYGTYGNLHDLDVSSEIPIVMPNLPRSLEGMTIVQVSDLHVGPYIREKELRDIVSVVNGLRPDLVVITGDVIDRYLTSLPDAVRGLSGIRGSLGTYAVLGNHDIYSDRYSYDRQHHGGVRIAEGLDSIGIRTLRNDVVHVTSSVGNERLALLGLDWLNANDANGNFFFYDEQRTKQVLRAMVAQVEPGEPTVLLAHHPDTFDDAHDLRIGLTLSGHTHGGGQILLGNLNGVPLGVAMLRFKYLSGLYQEHGSTLYVNRGIGYLGVPIRINCPPEISRFRLACPTAKP